MSDKKQTFIMYKDWIEFTDTLSNEETGILFKAINRYQNNMDVPEMPPSVAMVFNFFVRKFKEDEKKYNETCERRSVAAARREEAKRLQKDNNCDSSAQQITESTIDGDTEHDHEHDNEHDNDHDTDIIYDNISITPLPPLTHEEGCRGETEGAERKKENCFETFWEAYPKKTYEAEARKEFDALSLSDTEFIELMQLLDEWENCENWMKNNGRYITRSDQFLKGTFKHRLHAPNPKQNSIKEQIYDTNKPSFDVDSFFNQAAQNTMSKYGIT